MILALVAVVLLALVASGWAAVVLVLGRGLLGLERWRVESMRDRADAARVEAVEEQLAELRGMVDGAVAAADEARRVADGARAKIAAAERRR